MALLWAADLRVCETRVGCAREVAEKFRATASQWVCLGLAAALPLPVVGGRFEDEGGGGAVDRERAPEYGALVPGDAAGRV